jgi:hypothetical protein
MSIARAIFGISFLSPFLALLACGGTQMEAVEHDAAAPSAGGASAICDPFAAKPLPIALGTLIAVGQDATGAIYAVDQVGFEQRVFVSDANGNLVRQRLAGSGMEAGDTFDRYVFNVTDYDPPFVLQIDIPSGATKRMGLVIGELKDSKTFVIGQQGEELTVLPNDAVAGMPVQNLPGTVELEYAASLATGEVLVVTRPRDDWDYTDFRVYMGSVGALAERHLTSATRFLDGGSTHIIFELDGQSADAYFPVVFADGGFARGPATLTVAGSALPLTLLDAAPAGAVYVCLP